MSNLTTSPQEATAGAYADAILIMRQVQALATQILLRPDLSDERAKMILETIESHVPAGARLMGARPVYTVTSRNASRAA